jgi:hypothetical protein
LLRIASTVWFLAFVGATILLFRQAPGVALRDNDVVFAPKNFADIGQSVVGISGTLTGDGLGYKNNTTHPIMEASWSCCIRTRWNGRE